MPNKQLEHRVVRAFNEKTKDGKVILFSRANQDKLPELLTQEQINDRVAKGSVVVLGGDEPPNPELLARTAPNPRQLQAERTFQGIRFASPEARDLARSTDGLTPARLRATRPSGADGGYTADDVRQAVGGNDGE